MEDILWAAATISVFVFSAAKFFEKYIGTKSVWLPFIQLVSGIVIGVTWSLSFDQANLLTFTWGGLLAGFAAGGFYELDLKQVKEAVRKKLD